jgi:hypothetical protein
LQLCFANPEFFLMRSFQKKEAREILRFIQVVPLFQGFYSRQKDNLAKRFVEREYKVGEKIVTQGLGGEGFFILIKGHADAFRTRADGTQMQVNSFGPTVFLETWHCWMINCEPLLWLPRNCIFAWY